MAVANFNASNKCNKCGLTSADCASGFAGQHVEVRFDEPTCLNGMTFAAGSRRCLPLKVQQAHAGKHAVTNVSA